MIKVDRFVFNPFQENTYLLSDETGECIIIDPGCFNDHEEKELDDFITGHKLKIVGHVLTHCHIDHILGMAHIFHTYGIRPVMHKESLETLHSAADHGKFFGIEMNEIIEPVTFLNEGDLIKFGHAQLEIKYTPGHVDGHICLISHQSGFVIAGDVLFQGSIGRTDLPTGNFKTLEASIKTKLYTLPDDYIVYPGHGPHTFIGSEKQSNPFIRG